NTWSYVLANPVIASEILVEGNLKQYTEQLGTLYIHPTFYHKFDWRQAAIKYNSHRFPWALTNSRRFDDPVLQMVSTKGTSNITRDVLNQLILETPEVPPKTASHNRFSDQSEVRFLTRPGLTDPGTWTRLVLCS